MPIMCFETIRARRDASKISDLKLHNGMTGVIHDIDDSNNIIIRVTDDEDPVSVTPKEFTDHIVVDFASTVYKTQGETIDYPFVILDFHTIAYIEGGLNSVLTRSRWIQTIYV